MTEEYMLQEVAPRIRVGINASIPRAAGEDDAELPPDGFAIALGLLHSAKARNKMSAQAMSPMTRSSPSALADAAPGIAGTIRYTPLPS